METEKTEKREERLLCSLCCLLFFQSVSNGTVANAIKLSSNPSGEQKLRVLAVGVAAVLGEGA
jgi:hypothetical protein